MVGRVRFALIAVALVVTCWLAALPAGAAQPAQSHGTRLAALADQVVDELNAVRAKRGLAPLRVSPGLVAAAARHSREMAQKGFFDHRSADGSLFWKRVARHYPAGGSRSWAVGENLLWSSPNVDAAGAIRMWMGSPSHRKNMLDGQWREVGIFAHHATAAPGFYKGLEVTIITADFGIRD